MTLRRLLPLAAVFMIAGTAGANARSMPMHGADPAAGPAQHAFPGLYGQHEDAKSVLRHIEEAVGTGDVKLLTRYLASKPFLNLFTGENGLYSAEQSFFILRNFFSTCTPVAFFFSAANTDSETPYGVGTLTYVRRGQRGTAQVYIALSIQNGNWRITQVTVATR